MKVISLILNVLKVWLFLFFCAFVRHECAVFRVESKMEYLDIMGQTGNKELALGLISIVESKKIPIEPVWYNPLSIAYALDSEHDVAYTQ